MLKSRLTVVVFVTMLAGLLCTSAAMGAPTVIKHWYWVPAADQPAYMEMLDEFNRTHSDVQVEWENVPHNEMRRKFITAFTVGAGPDTFVVTSNWIGEFAAMGMMVPLNDLVGGWDATPDIYENLWENSTIDGKVWGLPWKLLVSYLYYRTDWFEEAGLTPPVTLYELDEAARKLVADTDGDGRIDRYGFGLRGGAGGGTMYYTFMQAWGSKLYDEAGRAAFKTPETIAATDWYLNLYKDGIAPPSAPGDAFAEIVAAFKSGQTAMLQHHIGTHVEMDTALGDKVSAVTIPKGPNDHHYTESGLIMHAISANTDKQEAAWKFISWMSEEWAVRHQAMKLGSVPILKSVGQEPYFQQNRFFKASIDGIPVAKPWPTNAGWGYIVDSLTPTLIQQGLMGETTAEEIVDEIQIALEEAAE
jgi:multiple sugar transport system substrate-binding protein